MTTLICTTTGRKTHITDASDEREIRAAADRLVARTNPGYFASFGSICLDNLGRINRAEISRMVGNMREGTGHFVDFEMLA